MDNHTEQLADGVWRIEVGWYTNAFVLANDGRSDAAGLTLVDTGLRSSGPRLVRSIRLAGLAPRSITDVLLSHWHPDHAGAAARFARSSAAPAIRVGTEDHGIVAGVAPPPRATLAAGPLRWAGSRLGRPPAPVPAVGTLAGGEQLAVAGGLQVVAAPGHTRGHCAFWLAERGVLLAGDAVMNVLFLSRGPRPLATDPALIPGTLRRLAALQPDTLAPGHGPPVTARAAERLAALVS